MGDLVQGKHILITGATNGIGLAAAQALAALGANVAIVGRNETRELAHARIALAAATASRGTHRKPDLVARSGAVHGLQDEIEGELSFSSPITTAAGSLPSRATRSQPHTSPLTSKPRSSRKRLTGG
jgi:dehydrogenase/reductase SDR family member 12